MKESDDTIVLGRKIACIVVAWIVTAILMLPATLYDPSLFPAGLFPTAGADESEVRHSWRLKVGWLLYLILMLSACLTRRKRVFFNIYGFFCLILVLNIIGCRMIASGIH